MTAIKRIEVILPEALVPPFTEVIEAGHYRIYSVNAGLSGRSRTGSATVGLADAMITIVCSAAEAADMITAVKAFLERYGGIACVVEGEGINIA